MRHIADGQILLDQAPLTWGFTSRRFEEYSYLWKEGGRILISLVGTRNGGRGHFSHLVKAIECAGFTVAVPTPLGHMAEILVRWGFEPHLEDAPEMGEPVEVWERPKIPHEAPPPVETAEARAGAVNVVRPEGDGLPSGLHK